MIRVLHCPNLVGGNPHSLARAERAVGLDSWAVTLEEHQRGYTADEFLWSPGTSLLKQYLRRAALLRRALHDFDVVHFNFGQSIFPQGIDASLPTNGRYPRAILDAYRWFTRQLELRDLPILHRAGKGIVVTYQGGDARQLDYCREHFAIHYADDVTPDTYPPDDTIRRQVARFSRYADRVFSVNPDLLWVLRPDAEFVPYASVDPDEWPYVGTTDAGRPPVILHAPTHRGAKGTSYLLDAIDRLKREGVELEFVLVEGLTHTQAREVYARSDLLVDQLLAGWYGGLAVELMAMGKPVICYIRDSDLHFIPEGMRKDLPIINATPQSIYEVLREWITHRRPELAARGAAGRHYAAYWHSPHRIATRMRESYEAVLQEVRHGRARHATGVQR